MSRKKFDPSGVRERHERHEYPENVRLSGAAIARLAGISKQRVSVLLAQGRSPDEIIMEQRLKKAAGVTRAPAGGS